MERTITNELYCRDCGHESVTEHSEYECPVCGSENVANICSVKCDCGRKVYLQGFTNECPCGRRYNGFGQQLAPVGQWDPEDRYGTFGPQNGAYEY